MPGACCPCLLHSLRLHLKGSKADTCFFCPGTESFKPFPSYSSASTTLAQARSDSATSPSCESEGLAPASLGPPLIVPSPFSALPSASALWPTCTRTSSTCEASLLFWPSTWTLTQLDSLSSQPLPADHGSRSPVVRCFRCSRTVSDWVPLLCLDELLARPLDRALHQHDRHRLCHLSDLVRPTFACALRAGSLLNRPSFRFGCSLSVLCVLRVLLFDRPPSDSPLRLAATISPTATSSTPRLRSPRSRSAATFLPASSRSSSPPCVPLPAGCARPDPALIRTPLSDVRGPQPKVGGDPLRPRRRRPRHRPLCPHQVWPADPGRFQGRADLTPRLEFPSSFASHCIHPCIFSDPCIKSCRN